MNKKVLILAIALVAAMLFSSLTTTLAAPKNQRDFTLYIQGGTPSAASLHANGYLFASPDSQFVVPPTPGVSATWHYRYAPYNPTNVWLVIGAKTIPYTRLSYTASVSGVIDWVERTQKFKVDETVAIYTTAAKTTVWGTIEIRTVTEDVYPTTYGVTVGTFEGHGTGALEGLKVQGTTSNEKILTGDPPALVNTRVRDGAAMGWPTA